MYTKKDKEYSMKIKNGEMARYYLSMANYSFERNVKEGSTWSAPDSPIDPSVICERTKLTNYGVVVIEKSE